MADNSRHPGTQMVGIGARRGFSLMDLMVSIAVVAILISILLPALSKAVESTRRVICQSNMREIGKSLHMYADDNFDLFPTTVNADFRTANNVSVQRPEETLFVRLEEYDRRLERTDGWDGLGLLLHPGRQAAYLSSHLVFYCPSHTGDHDASVYAGAHIAPEARIAGNYQYRLPFDDVQRDKLDPAMALVSDGLREQSDYNHIVGNNLLKVDGSVSWYADSNGALYKSLVESDSPNALSDARHAVAEAWDRLDLDPKRPISNPGKRHDHQEDSVTASTIMPDFRD